MNQKSSLDDPFALTTMLSLTNITSAMNSPPISYLISYVGSYILSQISKLLKGLSLQRDNGVTCDLKSHCSSEHLSTQTTQKQDKSQI